MTIYVKSIIGVTREVTHSLRVWITRRAITAQLTVGEASVPRGEQASLEAPEAAPANTSLVSERR